MADYRRIVAVLAAVALGSCRTPEPSPTDDPALGPWCYLGCIDSSDASKVEDLLRRHGILAWSEGSVVYGVFVRERFAQQALDLVNGMGLSYWVPTTDATPLPR